jgi:malonyl-CoA/methylmalonyl-CoA synthetase
MSQNASLYARLAGSFRANASRIALETTAGRQYRYADLEQEVARYAAFLREQGLQPGDRVVVQAEKSPESLFFYLACLATGVVYVPLNTAYRPAELSYFVGDAQPALALCAPSSLSQVEAMMALQQRSEKVFTLDSDGSGTLRAALPAGTATALEPAVAQPDDLAVIIYTSGTTGRSKGAMLTHRNLVSNADALLGYWSFGSSDVLLHALPIFHVHGLFVANHCALLSGAKIIWHGRFDVRAVIADLPRATVMMGVPTFYTRLLGEPDFTHDTCRSVRLFISGSAPLLAETFSSFESRTGHAILERYGMSETGMISSNPLNGERRAGTVGFPLPGVEVRITDGGDAVLPVGEPGGIQVRGPNVFIGYWRNPEKTREEFAAEGWFRTGDVGAYSADGYLSIVGRAKDLIITGGYNVYPKEIELAIDVLPGVLESAVVGIPHPDFGEAVTAVVIRRVGGPVLTEREIVDQLKTQLAGYKVPKRVHFMESLPRNAMGKVQKNLLRDQLAREGC